MKKSRTFISKIYLFLLIIIYSLNNKIMNLNRMIIPSKNIKFIKLCIVSPLFEILSNVVYLVSFFLLAFRILAMGSFFSNFQLNTLLSNYFDENYFSTIYTFMQVFYLRGFTLLTQAHFRVIIN